MNKEELRRIILENDIQITDVIDILTEENGVVGLALIKLGQQLKEYCYDKIKS
jgi:hypothetical protein